MKTRLTLFHRFALALAVIAVIGVAGCKTAKKTEEETAPVGAIEENTLGDSDSGKAMGLQTVHFPFDSFTLDGTNKTILKANSEILKTNPGLKIQIEGHCDQKGGIQYNIALGEKRANAVRKFLVDQGVKGDRLTTISYGKERLIDPSDTEEAMAKNRRANFVITAR